jgi:hypothetical protein
MALAAYLCTSVAYGAVLCARKKADGTFNSTVKIRDACRTGEAVLNPFALGGQGTPPSGGSTVVYKDANGVTIGPMSNSFQTCGMGAAIVEVGGTLVQFPVYDGPSSLWCLYFESADCSGQPFLRNDVCSSAFPPAGIVIGGTLYYSTGPAVLAAVNSALCTNLPDCQPADGNVYAEPAALVDAPQFTAPFHLAIQ